MRSGTWLFLTCFLAGSALITGLWSWPAYKNYQQSKSGQRAAELGAQLAFTENSYRARTGTFTDDFSQLAPLLESSVPCPLTKSPYFCEGYIYTLEAPHWLVAVSREDENIYLAFDLEQGSVDCTHALEALQRTPVCSAFN